MPSITHHHPKANRTVSTINLANVLKRLYRWNRSINWTNVCPVVWLWIPLQDLFNEIMLYGIYRLLPVSNFSSCTPHKLNFSYSETYEILHLHQNFVLGSHGVQPYRTATTFCSILNYDLRAIVHISTLKKVRSWFAERFVNLIQAWGR